MTTKQELESSPAWIELEQDRIELENKINLLNLEI